MLHGKRQKLPEMRRTMSITEFLPDVGVLQTTHAQLKDHKMMADEEEGAPDWLSSRHVTAVASLRGWNRRNSTDHFVVIETAPFLKNCGLCRRRLSPERDIFMYRGEMAFCSLECREYQMKHDEKNENKKSSNDY